MTWVSLKSRRSQGCLALAFTLFLSVQTNLVFPQESQYQTLVEQKYNLLQKLVRRIKLTDDASSEVQGSYALGRKSLDDAEKYLQRNQYREAENLINEGFRQLSLVSSQLQKTRTATFSRDEYNAFLDRLGSYTQVLSDIGGFDQDRYRSGLKEARDFFSIGEGARAKRVLIDLSDWMESSLIVARENQVLVHSLSFSSADERWEYELERNRNYVRFVELYTAQNPVPQSAQSYMDKLMKENTDYRQQAELEAGKGDYPAAIELIQVGTESLVRILRMAGVPIP